MILSPEVWILVVSALFSLANAEIPSDNDDEGMLSGLATEKIYTKDLEKTRLHSFLMLLKLLMPSVGFSFKTYGELLQNIGKSRHLSATEFPGIFIFG